MSNKYFAVLILIIILAFGGYFLLTSQATAPSKIPAQTKEPMQIPQTGVSIVLSEQNNSGQAGIATIVEKNGKVVVSLKLTGALVDTPQPAHLHLGTCEKPGEVKFSLRDVTDGQSETTLDLDINMFNKKLPLILNVHKSEQESNIYASCGVIPI